jgi:hypothetical protein
MDHVDTTPHEEWAAPAPIPVPVARVRSLGPRLVHRHRVADARLRTGPSSIGRKGQQFAHLTGQTEGCPGDRSGSGVMGPMSGSAGSLGSSSSYRRSWWIGSSGSG